ncbi:MAG TPA: PA14 domain-containing protein [Oligoflexia bacterium]|nr:PA14 domain-containing protein [Oligoflexia bacterium]
MFFMTMASFLIISILSQTSTNFCSLINRCDWRASYFVNPGLRGKPYLIREESSPNYNWDTKAPIEGLPPDLFSVRWESTLLASETCEAEFMIYADDGFQFFIDEKLVFENNYQSNGKRIYKHNFSKGKYHLTLDYYELSLGAFIEFEMKVPNKCKFSLTP